MVASYLSAWALFSFFQHASAISSAISSACVGGKAAEIAEILREYPPAISYCSSNYPVPARTVTTIPATTILTVTAETDSVTTTTLTEIEFTTDATSVISTTLTLSTITVKSFITSFSTITSTTDVSTSTTTITPVKKRALPSNAPSHEDATKLGSEDRQCSLTSGHDRIGNVYVSFYTGSIDTCHVACENDSKCASAQYHHDTEECCLKDEVTTLVLNIEVDTFDCYCSTDPRAKAYSSLIARESAFVRQVCDCLEVQATSTVVQTASTQTAITVTTTISTDDSVTSDATTTTIETSTIIPVMASDITTTLLTTTTVSTTSTASTTVKPTIPPQANSFAYMGCYLAGAEDDDQDTEGASNTVDSCAITCASFIYMALFDGDYCICSNELNGNTAGTLSDNSNCNVVCTGTGRQYCGGGYNDAGGYFQYYRRSN